MNKKIILLIIIALTLVSVVIISLYGVVPENPRNVRKVEKIEIITVDTEYTINDKKVKVKNIVKENDSKNYIKFEIDKSISKCKYKLKWLVHPKDATDPKVRVIGGEDIDGLTVNILPMEKIDDQKVYFADVEFKKEIKAFTLQVINDESGESDIVDFIVTTVTETEDPDDLP